MPGGLERARPLITSDGTYDEEAIEGIAHRRYETFQGPVVPP